MYSGWNKRNHPVWITVANSISISSWLNAYFASALGGATFWVHIFFIFFSIVNTLAFHWMHLHADSSPNSQREIVQIFTSKLIFLVNFHHKNLNLVLNKSLSSGLTKPKILTLKDQKQQSNEHFGVRCPLKLVYYICVHWKLCVLTRTIFGKLILFVKFSS